jgi:hypothetical protein
MAKRKTQRRTRRTLNDRRRAALANYEKWNKQGAQDPTGPSPEDLATLEAHGFEYDPVTRSWWMPMVVSPALASLGDLSDYDEGEF